MKMTTANPVIFKTDTDNFTQSKMQKDIIIKRLKEKGCRITKQRLMLLDIILEEECSCSKEIYYKAAQKDKNIGAATVYRMVNTLEEIGAISRKNMYRIACDENCGNTDCHNCTIELEDGTVVEMNSAMLNHVIRNGLKVCGFTNGQNVKCVISNPCRNPGCSC